MFKIFANKNDPRTCRRGANADRDRNPAMKPNPRHLDRALDGCFVSQMYNSRKRIELPPKKPSYTSKSDAELEVFENNRSEESWTCPNGHRLQGVVWLYSSDIPLLYAGVAKTWVTLGPS